MPCLQLHARYAVLADRRSAAVQGRSVATNLVGPGIGLGLLPAWSLHLLGLETMAALQGPMQAGLNMIAKRLGAQDGQGRPT